MIAEMKGRSFHCSFCGKSGSEVANIMAGTPQRMPGVPQQMIGKSAFICDECVRRCSQMVRSGPQPDVGSHKHLTF